MHYEQQEVCYTYVWMYKRHANLCLQWWFPAGHEQCICQSLKFVDVTMFTCLGGSDGLDPRRQLQKICIWLPFIFVAPAIRTWLFLNNWLPSIQFRRLFSAKSNRSTISTSTRMVCKKRFCKRWKFKTIHILSTDLTYLFIHFERNCEFYKYGMKQSWWSYDNITNKFFI